MADGPRRLRIVNTTGVSRDTRIEDADTGEEANIPGAYIQRLSYEVDVRNATTSLAVELIFATSEIVLDAGAVTFRPVTRP